MRRDTAIFTLAGTVFGFVAGYMIASWHAMPGPATVTEAASTAPAGPPATPSDSDELRVMETVAASQPKNAAARVEIGNHYMDQHRWDEAIRWYREALAIAPDAPDVATDLGSCYVHSGRPAEGLAEFDRVLRQNPDHRNARFNRGVALVQMGRAAEAADAWEALLKRYPGDPQFQVLQARIRELRGGAGPGNGQPSGPPR